MEASNSTSKNPTAFRMASMLVAAVVIGLAYNSVTPLGVRFGATKATPDDPEPALSRQIHGGYQNQLTYVLLQTDNGFGNKPMLLAKAPGGKKLTWPETEALLAANEIVLVDARDSLSYQTEHIPGAISLPATSSDAELTNFASRYPRDTALVLYCGSWQCPSAHNLARDLRSKKWGYTNVRVMTGGFAEYRASKTASQR